MGGHAPHCHGLLLYLSRLFRVSPERPLERLRPLTSIAGAGIHLDTNVRQAKNVREPFFVVLGWLWLVRDDRHDRG